MNKAQISIEYIVILAFVVLVITLLLSSAFFYGGNIKDRLKMVQLDNFANKIITSAEAVDYQGTPSKATISAYLPEGVSNLTFFNRGLYIEAQLTSGIEKKEYSSNVLLIGNISVNPGVKKITIQATNLGVIIS
ncbi:MAG: hypothetical protein WC867_01585 [Candidatus Pacearchaeota archaeon]|jgi:hypothetical protein